MDKIIDQFHSKQSYWLSFSKLLERGGYFGIRSVLVLFLTDVSFNLPTNEALTLYGYFTGILIFTSIIGAAIGDLVTGNTKAIILGGVLQAIGAFSLAIDAKTLFISWFRVNCFGKWALFLKFCC